MIITKIRQFLLGQEGQGMTEYIIIVALIAIAAIGIYTLFGDQIRVIMGGIVTGLTGVDAPTTDVTGIDGESGAKTLGDFGE